VTSDESQSQPAAPDARAPQAAAAAQAQPAEIPAPAEPTRLRPPRRNRWLDVALGVAAVLAVAGIAFAAGRFSAPAQSAFAFRNGAFGGNGGNGGNGPGATLAPGQTPGAFRGGLGGSLALEGSVVEVTADHLTVKLDSGQTVQVPLNSQTAYHLQAAGSSSDVQAGTRVLVQLQAATTGGGVRSGALPPASNVTVLSQ
jgi:hypothetical protein